MPRILVVDDEENIRESLSDILKDEGYEVEAVSSAEAALSAVRERPPELVLLDIWLPGKDGIEALKEMKAFKSVLPVIMITGHGSIELAIKSTRLGAYDFLEKPLSMERVLLTARRAIDKYRLEMENLGLRETLAGKLRLVGDSPAMKTLRTQIETAARSSSKVLITGESGSGKELVARLLHALSPRAALPFVEVNCAAIPQELIESELFGHEKGSFTGAQDMKKGKFELAHTGSIFLDEVGDMAPNTQAKVLRALETQEFQRVGGTKTMRVDVRMIAATNKDLAREVKKGAFREDLYYRLNVIPVEVPPLRSHREDIPGLTEFFLREFAAEYGRAPKRLSKEAMKRLLEHTWPGNVRELRNAVERLVIMSPSDTIEEKDAFFLALEQTKTYEDYFTRQSLKDARDAFEKDFLLRKLVENNWNVTRTAELLGIERSNLHRKIKSYGIDVPRGASE
jgi:two-component system nitrogen regulation response regulator NtrX